MYGWRARIGLIIPSSNTVMEPEFNKMAPEGVSIHAARMHFREVTPESLIKMEKYAEQAIKDLADAEVDVIIYGCTSGSLIKGKGYDIELGRKIKEISGIPGVTTSTAVIEALKFFKMDKISVATPYPEDVNRKEKEFLEGNKIKVLKIKGLGFLRNIDNGRQDPSVAYRLARKVYLPEADGVFISCTNFRTIEIIEPLERDFKKPVITSNQASFWAALKKVRISEPINYYGKLLTEGV